ncbi:MAG: cytochrome C, partial [Epsilonproteobacteria bacterium]|nr:cytochrome C [Campylobacterota bacterium]
MRKRLLIFLALPLLANNCLECHKGIEEIRDPQSKMAKEIAKLAKKAGFEGNSCIVCHGGNPTASTKEEAHKGTIEFFKTHKGPKEF